VVLDEIHENPLLVEDLDEEVLKTFKTAVEPTKPNTKEQREVYEQYIDEIGSNGLIKVVNELNPTCHSEGHELGKVFYAEVGELASALAACEDACYSGCTHGVLMEAFTLTEHGHVGTPQDHEHHIGTEEVYPKLSTLCTQNIGIRPGDCAHGLGHAMTALNEYNTLEAEKGCAFFYNKSMEYYCATGVYMEFVGQPSEKQKNKPLFEPCDTSKFPAACFRYIMPLVFRNVTAQLGPGGIHEVIKGCKQLSEFARIGCFHGVGNAHMPFIAGGAIELGEICGFGNEQDQLSCIDGAIERLSKYHGKDIALEICARLEDEQKELCIAGAEGQLYRTNKSFELYHPELFSN